MLKLQKKFGFKTYSKELEGSIVNYENLDNAQMRIHDYFKFLKFGYDKLPLVLLAYKKKKVNQGRELKLINRNLENS